MLLLLAALLPMAALGSEAPSAGRSFSLAASEWQRTFDAVEKAARSGPLGEEDRLRYDALLVRLGEEARAVVGESVREIEAQTRLLDALGPAPADGQPAEPREVARERKDILAVIGIYRSRQAQAELAAARAAALQEQVATAVRRRFLARLTLRNPSPLRPDVLAAAGADAATGATLVALAPWHWFVALPPPERQRLLTLAAAALVAASAVAWLLRRALPNALPLPAGATDSGPPADRRLIAATLHALADGAMPALVAAAPMLVLWAQAKSALPALVEGALLASLTSLGVFALAAAFAHAALTPGDSRRVLLPLRPEAAQILCRALWLLIAIAALDLGLRLATAGLAVSPALEAVHGLAYAFVVALGVALALRDAAWATAEPPPPDPTAAIGTEGECAPSPGRRSSLPTLRRFVGAVALVGPVAAAFGYTRLGVTVADTLLAGGLVVVVALGVRTLARGALGRLLDRLATRPRLAAGATAAGAPTGLSAAAARTALVWVRRLLDPLLLAAGLYALAPLWGVPRQDLARWANAVLSGFSVGGVTISLADITLALVVLAAALFATRAARRALEERVLPGTRLDLGIQHSLSVGAGYVGVVLAVLLAVAVLGIDLSNVALVAGALSVGIGFGLQNIVNNFVSGLILLIERPVKVGDWVVVGDKQGVVKRIHVRSTELETFERSTVILPNSELLSSPVVNWTHKDKIGRVDVRIGVDYGTDTQKVRETLLACANAHPEVMSWPQPFVVFLDFGDSALIFEVRAFLRDVEKQLRVGSDLRFAIEKAFREAGIEFPYPQHDIHLADIDRLTAVLGGGRREAAVRTPLRRRSGRDAER